MRYSDALWALVGGLSALIVSTVSSYLAGERLRLYYEKFYLENRPLGYAPSDIQAACHWAIVQFELSTIAFSAPIVVALTARNGSNYWIVLAASGTSSIVTLWIWMRFRNCNGPLVFQSKNRIRIGSREKVTGDEVVPEPRSQEKSDLIGFGDLWSAVVVLLNILVVLVDRSP